jgi:protein disulfide-isomerase A6
MHTKALVASAAALLLASPALGAGFYSKTSPVLQVDAKNYDRLVAKSNHTTVSISRLSLLVFTS